MITPMISQPRSPNNPILDEIDAAHANLSDPAKSALEQAHASVMSPPQEQLGLTGGTAGPSASSAAPGMQPPSALPLITQPNSVQQGHIKELNRLQDTGSGISQIQNPFLRTLGHIGEGVGSFFPGITQAIPGTGLHHQQLVGQAEDAVTNDETQNRSAADTRLRGAQATEQESLPELHRTQAELAAAKLGETATHHQNQDEARDNSTDAMMIKAGFKPDPQGHYVEDPDSQAFQERAAVGDLKKSQSELANARKAYQEALTNKVPEQIQQRKRSLDIAELNSRTAIERLGLSKQQFDARNLGVGPNGQPLPGSMITDDGRSVGSVNAANVRPTAQERNKGDLAQSVNLQVKTMREILDKRPDFFGPGNGRINKLMMAIGNNDPDALRYKAAADYLAEHSAAMFGSRASSIIHDLQQLNSPHFNVEALKAALDQAEQTAHGFSVAGVPRTAGSNANAAHAEPSGLIFARDSNGQLHQAPAGSSIPAGWKLEKGPGGK